MKNNAKRRGRPAIKPYLEGIIASMVWDERKRPEASRLPPKVLAVKIHRELEGRVREGDHLPAVSTLEKRIGFYARRQDPQDEPWCMGTLNDYPIPSEALEAVLSVWKYKVAQDETLTIREAKWAARLAGLQRFEGGSTIRGLRRLSDIATAYAQTEALCELAGHSTCNTGVWDRLIMGIPGGGMPVELKDVDSEEVVQSGKLIHLFDDDPPGLESKPDWLQTEGWVLRFDEDLTNYDWRFQKIAIQWEEFKKEVHDER